MVECIHFILSYLIISILLLFFFRSWNSGPHALLLSQFHGMYEYEAFGIFTDSWECMNLTFVILMCIYLLSKYLQFYNLLKGHFKN